MHSICLNILPVISEYFAGVPPGRGGRCAPPGGPIRTKKLNKLKKKKKKIVVIIILVLFVLNCQVVGAGPPPPGRRPPPHARGGRLQNILISLVRYSDKCCAFNVRINSRDDRPAVAAEDEKNNSKQAVNHKWESRKKDTVTAGDCRR
jgi:hypothetical protein